MNWVFTILTHFSRVSAWHKSAPYRTDNLPNFAKHEKLHESTGDVSCLKSPFAIMLG